ncbi:hypothetical protein M6D93_11515 [Jatrophihabitans telluris]|uniref:CHRD domain-containing protein n=1 Tax=Jatrophihabitans telluris TaxID=2038343 RepID=A0ABY4QU21_9ACTN|nr:hypothetical protein [Jatrophihabitans telluris]UQX86933.1 hypothetical protein M6D93_11515 [Jatrophihabitans telluris]
MNRTKKSLLLAAPVAALSIAALTMPGMASAAGSSSYQAQLNALNHSTGSGNVMISLNGSQATITEHFTGLAATFGGKPYPHVQHIHIGAKGTCPTTAADANNDGVISTTEGGASYGAIGTTLSTSGDTSPAAGTTLTVAPSGASYDYSRTITLDSKTLASLNAGTAVVVVHGLDPATLSKKAQGEKSDLVPSLPLAATSPTLCGTLVASQMSNVPGGSAGTGGGSTAGLQDQGLLGIGGALVAAGAVAGGLAMRRRTAADS